MVLFSAVIAMAVMVVPVAPFMIMTPMMVVMVTIMIPVLRRSRRCERGQQKNRKYHSARHRSPRRHWLAGGNGRTTPCDCHKHAPLKDRPKRRMDLTRMVEATVNDVNADSDTRPDAQPPECGGRWH